jgi:hypothetical protein
MRDDVIWTWNGDCLLRDSVAKLFSRAGVTGYFLRDIEVVDSELANGALGLHELVVTGWGGQAAPSTGISLDSKRSCPACQLLVYTGLTNPENLFDPQQWDGSDIFMIWPLPRFIFVSDRLARLLRSNEVTGIQLTPVEQIPTTSASLSPGRLSYWMPADRANALGASLDIS